MKDKGKYALGLVLILALAFFAKGIYESRSSPYVSPLPAAPENPNAVQIIEYSDFKCPYCGRAAGTVRQLQDSYGDKIEITFKHFPLPFHAGSDKAAEASECARDQGKFWEYHDRLFSDFTRGVDIGQKNVLKKIGSELGLETQAFNECIDSNSKKKLVQQQTSEGKSLGVTGTPTFFIEGEKLVGAQPYETFVRVIDAKLKQKQNE